MTTDLTYLNSLTSSPMPLYGEASDKDLNLYNAAMAHSTATPEDIELDAVVPLPAVDLDTRLTLASAGMDALIAERHPAAAEANEAAEAVTGGSSHTGQGWPVTLGKIRTGKSVGELLEEVPDALTASHPVLRLAADAIRTRGWAKGTYQDDSGAVCALGAIYAVTSGPDSSEANDAVRTLLARIGTSVGREMTVPAWNDSRPDREDVCRLMY